MTPHRGNTSLFRSSQPNSLVSVSRLSRKADANLDCAFAALFTPIHDFEKCREWNLVSDQTWLSPAAEVGAPSCPLQCHPGFEL